MNRLLSLCLVSLLLLIAGCGSEPKKGKEQPKAPAALKSAPAFVADSAYRYVEEQVAFGPRVPNSAAHRRAAVYLQQKLKQFGANVSIQQFDEQAYDGTTLGLTNIIGSFAPQKSKRILLAAHWDSRHIADKDSSNRQEPIDGANDGASGVGVLLEVARAIGSASQSLNVGVDIIFFDGEDYGRPHDQPVYDGKSWYCLGSTYWANKPHQANYQAYYGILLDMVGARNATFLLEGASKRFAPSVQKKVWGIANRLGHSRFFKYQDGPEIYDDHVPVNQIARIPMIDIIDLRSETTFFPQHHTHDDTLEQIDPATLQAVGQTVIQVLYEE